MHSAYASTCARSHRSGRERGRRIPCFPYLLKIISFQSKNPSYGHDLKRRLFRMCPKFPSGRLTRLAFYCLLVVLLSPVHADGHPNTDIKKILVLFPAEGWSSV